MRYPKNSVILGIYHPDVLSSWGSIIPHSVILSEAPALSLEGKNLNLKREGCPVKYRIPKRMIRSYSHF